MTVSSKISSIIYACDGSTTVFDVPFRFLEDSDLQLSVQASDGTVTNLVLNSDYTVTGANNDNGGKVHLTHPAPAQSKLSILRVMDLLQETDYRENERFPAESHERALDKLTMEVQQLQEQSDRAIKVGVFSDVEPDVLIGYVERIWDSVDNIDTVANDKSNIDTVANNIASVNTNVTNMSDINTNATNISYIKTNANNITDITTTASHISAVDIVSNNIPDISNVSNSMENVNTVANISANVTTVANNISDVNAAVTNMTAIQAAPAAASNAANSANNSHIWAEGTDAQVQALGGVHSSKGWAEQSTNANISLTNSPYTTNRILEIPQDIKLELNDGTLTLKADSKVYVPNGFEADGTTPKFDVVTIANDIVYNTVTTTTGTSLFFLYPDLVIGAFNGPNNATIDYYFSGPTAPTVTLTYALWYDTTNNIIKRTFNNGDTWHSGCSLPLSVCSYTNGTGVTSIDQVFNGFGYIGSTLFALPGVKVQIPNGRNADGTCKSVYGTIRTVQRVSANPGDGDFSIRIGDNFIAVGKFVYDAYTNYNYNQTVSPSNIRYQTNVGTVSYLSGKITSFEPYTVDSVVNSNASNFSQAGRSYLSGLGMPSGRYIDLTLGASGSAYTAPANGWFRLVKKPTATGQYILFSPTKYYNGQSNSDQGAIQVSAWTESQVITIPVLKGDKIYCYYNFGGETIKFEFRYAEGETNV